MPIRVNDIKELDESECYSNRTEGIITKIIDFLKRNSEHAYTPKEIHQGLEGEKTAQGLPIRPNALSHALHKVKNSKRNFHIVKKGNFYWYENNEK